MVWGMAVQSTRRPQRPLDHDPGAVKAARVAKGWKQVELAEAVSISPGHMSEIESGTRNAPPWLLVKLAEALACPVAELLRKRSAA